MAIGLPAGFSAQIDTDIPRDAAILAAEYAFELLGWKLISADGAKLIAKVPGSVSSWGERIQVEISSLGRLDISSRCVSPLQLFDWGKNRRNVELFTEILERKAALADRSMVEPEYMDERGETPVERAFSDRDA